MARGGSGDAQRRAYALLETGAASARRGDVSGAIGLWNEAKALFEQVEDLRGACQALDLCATALAGDGRPREAIPLWRETLELRRKLRDTHQQGVLLMKLCAMFCDLGQMHEAAEHGELAVPLLEEARDTEALVSVLNTLSGVAAQRNDRVAGRRSLEKLLDAATRAGNGSAREEALRRLGVLHFAEGHFARAAATWESCRDLRARAGNALGAVEIQVLMGQAQAEMGDGARATALWQDALGAFERANDHPNEAWVLNLLAGVAAGQGDLERALLLCQRLRQRLVQLGRRQNAAELLTKMADLVEARGDHGRAIDFGRQALKIFEQLQEPAAIAGALMAVARFSCQHGDFAEALSLAERAVGLVDQRGVPTEMAAARALMAEASGRAGNPTAALELWQKALALAPALENCVVSQKTLYEMSYVCLEKGDVAGGLSLWQQTVEIHTRMLSPADRNVVLTSLVTLSRDKSAGGNDDSLLDQAIQILVGVEEKREIAILLGWRAHIAAYMGEGGLAFSLLQRSAQLQLEAGDDANRAVSLMRMATMLADSAPTAALPLYQQAFALFEKAGNEEGRSAAAAGMASVSGGAAQG